MIKIMIDKTMKGTILDIGGGGEGVMGRIYQSQVTAIDNRQEELDGAPEGFTKLLMDACNLEFEDNLFDNITLFYTLMYIEKEKHHKVIKEAYRVLKNEGSLYIWDTNIIEANPFLVKLHIEANNSIINTTYGIYKKDPYQDDKYFTSICESAGFRPINKTIDEEQFYLHFKK